MVTENEIDLGYIILKIFSLLKKYFLLLIVSVLLCVGISLSRFYAKTPVYQSSMLMSTGNIKSSVSIGLVKELQELIDDQNFSLLSKKLSLAENSSKLKSVDVESIEEKVNNGKADVIKIIIKTTETGMLPDLQKSIVNYLEETPYIKKNVGIETQRLNDGITFLTKELSEISKLKANISKIGETGNIDGTSFDLEDIYRQSMELFERKVQLMHDLKTIENFQVIQGFTAYQNPVSPKLSLSLAGGFVAGLILAFLFIFFKELGRHLKTLEEQGE